MIPTLAFDIETIPDLAGLRLLHGLSADLADQDVVDMAYQKRRQSHGNDFLPLHLQRVIAISCALREGDQFTVWSLGKPEDSEATLVQRFFDGVEKYLPQLVSWNGGGFDLPVLHYRALVHGIVASRYWELGDDDREFKWNNYISRYHTRHLDLMDLLALYQPRASVALDELAKLCGFPGKLGMDGSQVWSTWRDGGLPQIRAYCETDAVNTFLMYLRFQRLRGVLTPAAYADEIALVRATLARTPGAHWQEFVAAWPT
ncbi:MAG: 3'-5' exonuclease [Proteobacteria bacterium]|nr:3'-5' exonuclease [Burkholderiales bacterium]